MLPLHTAANGVCDCPKRADCQHPGKHPRTMHGADDATTDPVQIRRYWTMWPHANIGLALKPAGLIDVSSDNERWQDTFERRGLPRTLTWQSGSGIGRHHLFQNPTDWPTTRVCKSGEYDILSDGYAVLPPSTNGVGPYVWLTTSDQVDDLPFAPLWVKELLPKPRPSANLPLSSDDDEPPVRLAGAALNRWHGADHAFKAGDRSSRLVAIAHDLARANASMRTIVEALVDRDEALGYRKFSERDDRDTRYAEIALTALSSLNPDQPSANLPLSSDDDDEPPRKLCEGKCAAQELLDLEGQILANPKARDSGKVALLGGVRHHFWALRRHPTKERPADLPGIAERVGKSNEAVSSGLRQWDGKPGSPLFWRTGTSKPGSFGKPVYMTLLAESLADFGRKTREFDPELRKWGGDQRQEPATPCEDGSPAVAQVTERLVRTYLVAEDGCEYQHSRWEPGKTTIRPILLADEGVDMEIEAPPSANSALREWSNDYTQVAAQVEQMRCARCGEPTLRVVVSRVFEGGMALCERCWAGPTVIGPAVSA